MHRHEPATDTAKKDIKFEWNEAQQLSYDKLKATLDIIFRSGTLKV
jgi:hypothetical protein